METESIHYFVTTPFFRQSASINNLRIKYLRRCNCARRIPSIFESKQVISNILHLRKAFCSVLVHVNLKPNFRVLTILTLFTTNHLFHEEECNSIFHHLVA